MIQVQNAAIRNDAGNAMLILLGLLLIQLGILWLINALRGRRFRAYIGALQDYILEFNQRHDADPRLFADRCPRAHKFAFWKAVALIQGQPITLEIPTDRRISMLSISDADAAVNHIERARRAQ